MEKICCKKCGEELLNRDTRCPICGTKKTHRVSDTSLDQRIFPIGGIILVIAGLIGILAFFFIWGSINSQLFTGFEIITGAMQNTNITDFDIDSISLLMAQYTQDFLYALAFLAILSIVIPLAPLGKIRNISAIIIFLLYIVLDICAYILIQNMPPPVAPGLIFIDGKGYHLSTISLFIGSFGSIINLIKPRISFYKY